MARQPPSIPTIKQLFAVSCNLCAYPDCTEKLFDESGNSIGEICHIEAAEKGGERYNRNQTDVERRSFENLIVFCRNHHAVTDDVKKYTVEILKKMKNDHEEKCRSKPIEISDEQLDAIITNYNTQNNFHIGSGQQFNTQTGNITIHQGMTSKEVESLVTTLFEKNFPKLRDDAVKQVMQNMKAFERIFVDKANTDLTPIEQARFADPDIQYVLNDAIFTASRKNDEELRQNLADLVMKRIKNDDSDLKKIVFNEAIATMKKLTNDQLKIITLCFILRYTSPAVVANFEQANKFLETLQPVLDFKRTPSEFQHIQYAGCGDIGIGSFDLLEYFRNGYSMIFIQDFEKSEIDSLDLPDLLKNSLIIPSKEIGKYHFIIPNKYQLEKYLDQHIVAEPIRGKILSAYTQHIPQGDSLKQIILEKMPLGEEIFTIHEKTLMNSLKLTSVGIAIAITYYERITEQKLDVDIWIN